MTKQSKKSNKQNDLILESELPQNLCAKEIQRDIKHLSRMIKRADYKIELYKRKIKEETTSTKKTKSLVQKGLSFFNLKSNTQTRA